MNLENTIKEASNKLKNNNITSHELDAQIILADIMGFKRELLIINDNLTKTIMDFYITTTRLTKEFPYKYKRIIKENKPCLL